MFHVGTNSILYQRNMNILGKDHTILGKWIKLKKKCTLLWYSTQILWQTVISHLGISSSPWFLEFSDCKLDDFHKVQRGMAPGVNEKKTDQLDLAGPFRMPSIITFLTKAHRLAGSSRHGRTLGQRDEIEGIPRITTVGLDHWLFHARILYTCSEVWSVLIRDANENSVYKAEVANQWKEAV